MLHFSGEENTMIGRLHVAVVLLTAASLVVSPAYAEAQQGQDQNQAQQQQQGQASAGTQPPSQPQAQTGAPATEPARDLRGCRGARLFAAQARFSRPLGSLHSAKYSGADADEFVTN